eukprot:TRINITY_DN4062_c0_g1::TRINITY_DN4062_c0_g1_i1::g.12004::m.12004 TRINITY_DN4062_c0_g1::TRINITY_DN4062_c0_g1_i1::g.12004  ORF type:complete len:387 (-),score=7.11,sp/O74545/YCV6_SCHPO/29.52/2e-27,Lactamase_B_2/PF12706.2/1.9e-16,Lactamase_B/PF00753.22/8.5e-05 TRINITY_DN4062_c0_g1_i1:106-1227(-)
MMKLPSYFQRSPLLFVPLALLLYSPSKQLFSALQKRFYRSSPATLRPTKTILDPKKSYFVVLGSGSSTGVPHPSCVSRPAEFSHCTVCAGTIERPPEDCKNYRGNPSLMLCYSIDGSHKYIQFDCGKTFREACVRWYPRYGIPSVDAIVLSHDHADAILGLDDVRGIQRFTRRGHDIDVTPVPIYLDQRTLATTKRTFPYLHPSPPPVLKPGEELVVRRVAQLEWRSIDLPVPETSPDTWLPFDVCGLHIKPLPVMHGEDYVSLGFEFGTSARFIYISDVSRIPKTTLDYLLARPIDYLILDSLFKVREHNTHFNLPQALECIRQLRPKKSWLIGLTHDFDHDVVNTELSALKASEGIDVQLSHDGMCIPLDI